MSSTSTGQANKVKKYVPSFPLVERQAVHAQFATLEPGSHLGEEHSTLSVGHGRESVSLLSSTIPTDRMATWNSRSMVEEKHHLIR